MESWWVLAAVGAVLAVFAAMWRPVRAASREAHFAARRRDFHTQRERLEARFIRLASAEGKPSGPHWADCEFEDDVAYVRNRRTGELSAFVGMSVAHGRGDDRHGGASHSVGRVHCGTAVFRFNRDRWDTDGRAYLNLTPAEAIRLHQSDLEMVDQEMAQRS